MMGAANLTVEQVRAERAAEEFGWRTVARELGGLGEFTVTAFYRALCARAQYHPGPMYPGLRHRLSEVLQRMVEAGELLTRLRSDPPGPDRRVRRYYVARKVA